MSEVIRRKRREAGVTLIEMLVFVTIIALFAALVLPKMMGQADKARKTAARAQINAYLTTPASYKLYTEIYTTSQQVLRPPTVAPDGANNHHETFLQKHVT